MNAAFLLLTTAWLAGAGPDPACCDDGWCCPCDEAVGDGWCCDDGGWGPSWGWGPGYGCGWAPAPERRKERCLKRLFRRFHHEEAPCPAPGPAPCFQPCYQPAYPAPCFQPYFQTPYGAENCWDCRDGSCHERHGCLARLKRHFHHKERCLTPEEPPCWQPTCPPVTCYQQPCEISFSRKHSHRPHCGLFHHHHKAPCPAPCCPLCEAPCVDCCPVCTDGCCGPFDGWSGGGCTDCDCGPEYGGPAYGLTPKAAPAPKPAAKPEKIGSPKTPPKGEDEED